MRIEQFPLSGSELGTIRTLTALHFGDEKSERHIYIQAGLSSNEPLSSLAAFHLHQGLLKLEKSGQVQSHIVLVPMANPTGIAQDVTVFSADELFEKVSNLIDTEQIEFTEGANHNTKALRLAIKRAMPPSSSASLSQNNYLTLLQLASDADLVIDLRCNVKQAVHIATSHQSAPVFETLARYLDSDCQLFDAYIDEQSFAAVVWALWAKLAARFPGVLISNGCATANVGLRSAEKMTHKIARHDAQAIVQFLSQRGDIGLTEVQLQILPDTTVKPTLRHAPEKVLAPFSGLVVYHVSAGSRVRAGEALVDVIDPIQGVAKTLTSPVSGFVFSIHHAHAVKQGDFLYEISTH